MSLDLPLPGEIFIYDGKKINTPEGLMVGNVSLRVIQSDVSLTIAEVFSVDRQEWEWMLNKTVKFNTDDILSLIQK